MTAYNKKSFITQISPYNGHRDKKIVCIETGIIYNTLTEAAEKTGVSISMISNCINEKRDSVKGLGFKKV